MKPQKQRGDLKAQFINLQDLRHACMHLIKRDVIKTVLQYNTTPFCSRGEFGADTKCSWMFSRRVMETGVKLGRLQKRLVMVQFKSWAEQVLLHTTYPPRPNSGSHSTELKLTSANGPGLNRTNVTMWNWPQRWGNGPKEKFQGTARS